MEGEILNLDAFLLEAGKEIFGHIEASSRSGGAAKFVAPNGLIAFYIVGSCVTMEIGRKWNVAMI